MIKRNILIRLAYLLKRGAKRKLKTLVQIVVQKKNKIMILYLEGILQKYIIQSQIRITFQEVQSLNLTDIFHY